MSASTKQIKERYYAKGTAACIAVVVAVAGFSVWDARESDTMTPQQIKAAAQTAREAGQYPTGGN